MKNKMMFGFLCNKAGVEEAGGGAKPEVKPEVKAETKPEVKPEVTTATPPGPEAAKPAPALPRMPFSSLCPEERLYVCRVARNQIEGALLPLEVRRAVLAQYEGIPEGAFSPDPSGPGWADRLMDGAERALMVIVGLAAGAMGLLLLVETGKAILRATGVMASVATPKALPVEVSVTTEGTDTVTAQ